MKLAYFLSSEEWGPGELVSLAEKPEAAGFDALYVQQIGPEQDSFFSTYSEHVLPVFG